MVDQPKYRSVGRLDYSDNMGTLTPVLSCQSCGALVVDQEIHDLWHGFKPCGCHIGTTDRDCPDCNDGEVIR